MASTNNKSLKKAWTAYRNGDKLSDDQILRMIEQLKAGIAYMSDRLPEFYLAWKESIHDLAMLESFAEAREILNKVCAANEQV